MANKGDINKYNIQPNYPDNWELIDYDRILAKTSIDIKLKSKDINNMGTYPVVDQGSYLISGFVDDSSLLYKGDLPVVIFGDHTRNIKYIDFEFCVGADGTKILKPKIGIDTKFLYYNLLSLDFPNFGYSRHFSVFKALDFPLPPLAEQERIVAKLDNLFAEHDKIKNALERIPQLLKDLRQQVLNQAVTGKLTEQWRKGKDLDDATIFIDKIVAERNTNLPKNKIVITKIENGPFEVPEKWAFTHLQNLGEFTRGKSKHRPRNDKKLFNGAYPFIQTGEVARSNNYILNYNNTYNEFGLKQSRLFPKGTLCITIAANIAETGILTFDSCFPDSVVGYIPYKNLYTSEFVMYYIKTIRDELEQYAPSTAQKNINLGILFEIPFPIPPPAEQYEIVSRAKSSFAKIDAVESRYQKLKEKVDTLPQAILHKAFKGELVPQLPTDGDAKDLLAEIMAMKREVTKKK